MKKKGFKKNVLSKIPLRLILVVSGSFLALAISVLFVGRVLAEKPAQQPSAQAAEKVAAKSVEKVAEKAAPAVKPPAKVVPAAEKPAEKTVVPPVVAPAAEVAKPAAAPAAAVAQPAPVAQAKQPVQASAHSVQADDMQKIISNAIAQSQALFQKNLDAQVGVLRSEIAEMRSTILKEFQKFEVAEASPTVSEQGIKKNDKPTNKSVPVGDSEKKQALDQSITSTSKIENSINEVLEAIKKNKSETVIYNQFGIDGQATTAPKVKVQRDKELEGVVGMVNALKEELKQQRVLIQKALAEK